MLKGLFIPKVIKDKIYHFKIGYQNLLIFEFNKYKEELIINKNFSKILNLLIKLDFEVYFFDSFDEMEQGLDETISFTNEDFLVIIN